MHIYDAYCVLLYQSLPTKLKPSTYAKNISAFGEKLMEKKVLHTIWC